MRRAAVTGIGFGRLMGLLLECSKFVAVEKCHPMQGGVFRLKFRKGRRPGLATEPVWSFYSGYLWEIVRKHVVLARQALLLQRLRKKIEHDANRHAYMDQALTPVADDETDSLNLFNHTENARDEVVRTRKIAAITRGVSA